MKKNNKSIGKNKALYCYALSIIFAVLYLFTSIQILSNPKDVITNQSSKIKNVNKWKMTFRYEMDVNFKNDLEGMSEEVIRYIKSEGSVTFTRSRNKRKFVGEGTATYDLKYYTLTQMDKFFSNTSAPNDKYKIVNIEEGKGSTSIIKQIEVNLLEFDYKRNTYTFKLIPGEDFEYDFGVPTKSVMNLKIIDPLLDETSETGGKDVNRNQLKAMLPEKINFDEFVSTFSIEAFKIPLPFFGTKFGGSYTDMYGGIITWIIEPVENEKVSNDNLFETETWVHYHPEEYSSKNKIESVRKDISKTLDKSELAVQSINNQKPIVVYLVKEKSNYEIPISTGDGLVPVDLLSPDQMANSNNGGTKDGITQIIENFLNDSPEIKDESVNIRAAVYALFYGNFDNISNDIKNIVQEHPLILDEVNFVGNVVSVNILGIIDNNLQNDKIRIREQIKYTVTINSKKKLSVQILINGNNI